MFAVSSRRKRRVRDKWRQKSWYTVKSPSYFGGVELGTLPSDEPSKLVGRVIDATLYDVTDDFSHQYLKMHFEVTEVEGKTAHTIFKGHEYSRDYLRSLVRRRTTRVDGIFNVTTKDGYRLRSAVCALTLGRIKTSQEKAIRTIMKRIVEEDIPTAPCRYKEVKAYASASNRGITRIHFPSHYFVERISCKTTTSRIFEGV